MPRFTAMDGDRQSVATAPLDLSTTKRGSAGSRSAECGGCVRDGQMMTGCCPAPPACTETDALGRRCEPARNRPQDKSSSRLPFRKRPIPLEPETRTQPAASPGDGGGGGGQPPGDVPLRERMPGRSDDRSIGAPSVKRTRTDSEPAHGTDKYPARFPHSVTYGPCPVYGSPWETHGSALHPSLFASISMATRQDEDGDTALHIAVVQGRLAVVYNLIYILQWTPNSLNIYNNLRQTALHLAVITQQATMVQTLMSAGADPSILDRNGQTALHLCCEYNQRDCMAVVLSSPLSHPCLEIKNYQGLGSLHLAVFRGQKDLAQMLLDAGADINAMDIKSGHTPLMHAVENKRADMVHFLIENGCDVNSLSYSRNTALHYACGRGQVDTVRLLLKNGADTSIKNYHNDTPVMVAKNKKIADVLRGRGPKHIRFQEQSCVSGSTSGSNWLENRSPSPCHSRGCSPATTQHTPHPCSSQSPSVFQFY